MAMVTGRLIGQEKCPGVLPVGIGDIFQIMLGKCILKACGKDLTLACGIDQMFLVLEG